MTFTARHLNRLRDRVVAMNTGNPLHRIEVVREPPPARTVTLAPPVTQVPALDSLDDLVFQTLADMLERRYVLQSPTLLPTVKVNHVTCGPHPDQRGGYACITDPHGVTLSGARDVESVARQFLSLVGDTNARSAISRAATRYR